jgi:hypothetical protein
MAPEARRTCDVAGFAAPDVAMSAAATAAQHPASTISLLVRTALPPGPTHKHAACQEKLRHN